MPTYTYQCQTCGVQFDKYQKFDDKPLTRCPECRKGKVRRVLQPSAIVFKGSGWYKTDHRSTASSASAKSDGKAEKTETSDKPAAEAAAAPAGDAAPAKKKEAAPAKADD